MAQRFSKNIFTSEYKKTLGVDFLLKRKFIKAINKDIEFMIWDTAGQEYYDAITRRYYKGASGALIVFSICNRDSFKAVKSWKDKVTAECENIPIILVMNKIDLKEQAVISEKEANDLAIQLGLNLYKTSVKDNIMINDIFDNLATEFFNKGFHLKNNGLTDIEEVRDGGLNAGKIKKNQNKEGLKDKAFTLENDDKKGKDKKKKCC